MSIKVQLGASRAESPVRHVAAPLPVDALIACEGTSIAQQHCHVSRQLHTLGGDAHVLEHLHQRQSMTISVQ